MRRSFILILPLTMLCLVMIPGLPEMREKELTELGVNELGRGGSRFGEEKEFGEQRVEKGSFEFKASPLQDGSQLSDDPKRTHHGLSPREKADLVWSRILDDIPQDFAEAELRDLRSYVDELTRVGDRSGVTWRCWAPGTSRGKALVYHEVESLLGLVPGEVGLFANQFLGTGRWGNVASHDGSINDQGRPAVLTWSIVPDGTMAPGNGGLSAAASDLRGFLNGIYGSNPGEPIQDQPWFPVLESAFTEMEETCGVEFVFEENDDGADVSTFADGELGTRGDIRLAARALDGPNDTLAFGYSPGYGDLVIDSSDSFFNSTSASSIRLHNVVAHELGHAMGLSHVCPINETKLMEPLISLSFRGARFDEFQSLQRQYGDPLEHHSDRRNNDRSADATPVILPQDATLSFPRLSIDDNSDVDFFRLSLLEGEKISVNVEPALGSYLEGAQEGEDCSGGTSFDPGIIHDLSLEILGSDGSSVLASATSGGLGEGESIVGFEVPDDGDYFLRVDGSGANATQVFSLDIYSEGRPPRPEIIMTGSAIVEESGKVKNMRADPDESLKVRVELKNIGNLATENLQVSLAGPPNLVFFESEVTQPILGPNETGAVELVFGLQGACGIQIPLNLTMSDPLMESVVFELRFTLGEVIPDELINEGFDDSGALPPGWSNSSSGSGASWVVLSSANVSSAPNGLFCQGTENIGQSILNSPPVTLGGEGGTLTFQHRYDTEPSWDGCVLEASRNGGAWFDLLNSAAVVVSGGYNSIIRPSSTSGLELRDAWTGSSGSLITSKLELPSAWAGDELRFRWIIASDRSRASEGWYLDDVTLITGTADCEVHEPEFFLDVTEDYVGEGETVEVIVSSALPLVRSKEVSLSVSGEADPGDLTGDLSGSIPAGGAEAVISLLAVDDGLGEGDEVLTLTLVGEGESDSVILKDTFGFALWAASFSIPDDAPEDDIDDDGLSALSEYLLDTDPTDPLSVSDLSIQVMDGKVLFLLGNLPARSDATITAEKSTDLSNWTPATLTRSVEGLEVPIDGGKSFLRLVFSLNE